MIFNISIKLTCINKIDIITTSNERGKHYEIHLIVSECGRQLDCKFFDSLKEATTELELTYKHCLQGRHSEAFIKEDKLEAFIVDDCGCAETPIDNNCNFKIFEIK